MSSNLSNKIWALTQVSNNRASHPRNILLNAVYRVYPALKKLEWLLHLALAKMKTLQSASSTFLSSTFAYLLGHVRIKRLQKFEKRFFVLRKWHLLLSGAFVLRLIQKSWQRRAHNTITKDLRALMDAAGTYEEWAQAARALDAHENRTLPLEASKVAGLQDRTLKLKKMQAADDVHGLMWALRQDTSRNVGALLSAAAEQSRVHCVVPPQSVTEYIEEMHRALHHICHCSDLPIDERMAFVKELRHAYGRTGLVLSGGGSFSHFHFGISRALYNEGLLPRVLSGSSGGAIACAMLCTRTDAEIQESMDSWPTAPNTDFFGPKKGFKGTLKHLVSKGTIHSAEIYVIRLQRLMGDLTFQEAYARSGRVLNIAVVAADTHEPCRVLNYLTAPNVIVWSAVACSSAFPFLFEPQELLIKDASGNIVPHFMPCGGLEEEKDGGGSLEQEEERDLENISSSSSSSSSSAAASNAPGTSLVAAVGATATPASTSSNINANPKASSALETSGRMRRWCDGSLEEDLPMRCLGELFGVNYFLVSQCNPWMIPVLSASQLLPRRLAHLIELEVKHRCGQLLAIFPRNKLLKLISQPWYGDLNFVLPVTTFNVVRSAVNFTPSEILKAMQAGQRAVWSKLPAVRAACAVEVAVDAELRALTMQARAMRRREEHAAALTSHMRAAIPSWMDLKSLGLGTSSDSNEDMRSLGVRTPRGRSSTDRLHRLSVAVPSSERRLSQDSSPYAQESPQLEESQQQGSDDMEQLTEPWETGLLLHRSRSLGVLIGEGSGGAGGGGGGERNKLEGGVDVWKDLTALTVGEEGLDFIAP